MRRRSILLSLVLAPAVVETAQAQQLAWQTITGADGRFSFDIPAPFKQSNSTGAYNSIIRGYMFEWGGGRYGLDMTIIELDPSDPDHPATDVGVLLKNGQSNVQKRWPGSTVLQQGEGTRPFLHPQPQWRPAPVDRASLLPQCPALPAGRAGAAG